MAVRRDYRAQFAAVVRHRRRNSTDEQFLSLLNDFLKAVNLPPMTPYDLRGLEDDIDAAIPDILVAYLGFMGLRLRIAGVPPMDSMQDTEEELMRKHADRVKEIEQHSVIMQAITLNGNYMIKRITATVKMPDGDLKYIRTDPVTDQRVLDLIKEVMVLSLAEKLANERRRMTILRRQMSARNRPRRP